ncbi:MAG: enoyl-CoA hydratase/isomerase family protein [Mesorhizobium sp.]
MSDEAEILFARNGKAGVITLNRPKALNAVTHNMVHLMHAQMRDWETDAGVEVVILKGEGRAFSAGGDIMEVYRAGKEGRLLTQFFADEYRLNAYLQRFPKPIVSLIDGIVMGGGVGLSFHGSHRVVGEKALFAMPETGIGFFPDVGGSHLLSRIPGGFGMYLGLSGARIGPGDMLKSGLATHAVKSDDLAAIEAEIAETGDPDAVLAPLVITPEPAIDEAALLSIAKHFTMGSLADVVQSLQQAGASDEFAHAALEMLRKRSPTSLNVSFVQISNGAMLDMSECMRMEFRILNRMLAGRDFYEGIRAALIDKGDTPKWSPATLEEIDGLAIDAYFAPLEGGDLPIP